ncbi:hypothetical protein [Candidatus Clostridium stratigraminis]|uniref:Transposase n=1 Tax=Candidatus Clostridium stratigraminis TaxID=3381661 RepID=A0ABW8T1W5_9CLOT
MNVAMQTIELKLFKPGLLKREIIDEALENYTRAYEYLMGKASKEIDVIEESFKDYNRNYRANIISKWIDKDTLKGLNVFNIEPFKDSLKLDFSSTMAGFLSLRSKNKSVSFPANNGSNLRPIFFCRYSKVRNYSLLYDAEKDRYYAKIYLMNVRNKKRKRTTKTYNNELKYLDKNKEVYKEGTGKKTYVIFTLAFGKWQEKYLKDAIYNPEILKTARLIKRKKEYYLSINIVKKVDIVETVNYMGISRGNESAINYAVVDYKSSLICEGHEEIQDNITEDMLNKIANKLVKVALKNRCQVIMEKLIDRGDNLTFQNKQGKSFIPKINCSDYNKLCNIMTCKLMGSGLKNVIRVSGVSIFYTCPYCYNKSKSNRFSKEIMLCTSCGRSINIDKAGSLNLSRRLLQYKNEKIKVLVESTKNGIRFINKDLRLEYYPTNPFDCYDEFMKVLDALIENFYININLEKESKNYKRKLSLIKKIEANKNNFQLIDVTNS